MSKIKRAEDMSAAEVLEFYSRHMLGRSRAMGRLMALGVSEAEARGQLADIDHRQAMEEARDDFYRQAFG